MEKEKIESKQSRKERGLEHHKFLETMLKILLPLKQIKLTQLEKAYDMTAEDHGFELSTQEKESLFGFMKNIKQVVDVKDSSQKHDFDMMGIDQNGKLCVVDWKTGNFDSKRHQIVNNYVQENLHIKAGFIVYLDLGQKVEIKKESPIGRAASSHKEEEKKVDDNPLETFKQAKYKEKEFPIRREEQENDLAALSSILKEKELHSKGLKNDYGSIKYIELLRKLVNDPRNEKNQRWISWFIGKNADICKETCLVNIRDYFRKFNPLRTEYINIEFLDYIFLLSFRIKIVDPLLFL